MKIGVFDSGLGGLLIAKAIRNHLPDYDMIYLGDTIHVPYGSRSTEAIYGYTRRCMDFLFEQGCQLIINACNTSSAAALRRLQQQYLPVSYPDRRILGVIVPTLETAIESHFRAIGVLATESSVQSDIYRFELNKIDPDIQIHQKAAPLLVPLIENDGLKWVAPILAEYLAPLQQQGMECLILGCTHYPHLKPQIRDILGHDFPLLSQDEIIPRKLEDYLRRHPEIETRLSRTGLTHFCATDVTNSYRQAAHKIYGEEIEIDHVQLQENA